MRWAVLRQHVSQSSFLGSTPKPSVPQIIYLLSNLWDYVNSARHKAYGRLEEASLRGSSAISFSQKEIIEARVILPYTDEQKLFI